MSDKTDVWLPLYIGDYLSATQHLSTEQSGGYLHLLMHEWKEGALPLDSEQLRRITRLDRKPWDRAWPLLKPFFEQNEHGYVQKRLELERSRAMEQKERRSNHGRAGATARWGQVSANGMPEQCPSNANDVPGEWPSPSPSPLPKEQKQRLVEPAALSPLLVLSPTVPNQPAKSVEDDVVEGVFEHYCGLMGKNPKRYALTEKRRAKGRAAYRECRRRFPEDDQAELAMVAAVNGLAANDWNMGRDQKNPKRYVDWIDHLFKDVETMEKRWEDGVFDV